MLLLINCFHQIQLSVTGLSEYVIRTQPNDNSLSTLETAAVVISAIEGDPSIREVHYDAIQFCEHFMSSVSSRPLLGPCEQCVIFSLSMGQ
jgi:DTW domain-containing protein YfiP